MYDFTSKNRGSDRIVFLLTLDKKKKTERIIIGESVMVKLRIERNIGEVLYDETRPLGQLLLNFESDPGKEWHLNASYLADYIVKKFRQNKLLEPYIGFLRQKYVSGEPSAVFVAVKTWEEYQLCYGVKDGSDVFTGRVSKLYKSFIALNQHNSLWEIKSSKNLIYRIIHRRKSNQAVLSNFRR
ncbi:MAG: hypothetical protein LBC86_05785 [Oscillospiraceae bacterium]|jgi:hypothetical protein|nr:hypothetical protein [Oscillospiraceae bacterium]